MKDPDTPAFAVGCWQRNGQIRKMQQSELLPVTNRIGKTSKVMNPSRKMSFIVIAVITMGRDLARVNEWYDIPPRTWLELEPVSDSVPPTFIGSEARSPNAEP